MKINVRTVTYHLATNRIAATFRLDEATPVEQEILKRLLRGDQLEVDVVEVHKPEDAPRGR